MALNQATVPVKDKGLRRAEEDPSLDHSLGKDMEMTSTVMNRMTRG